MRFLLNVLFICQVALSGCGLGGKTEPAEGPPEFPVTTVVQRDVSTDVYFVADVEAVKNVEIRARVEGYLEEIYVDEGKPVSEDQLLFRINNEEYMASLNRAKANRKSADAELKAALVEQERVRLLVDKKVIATTETDLALANVEIARAKIEQARADEIAASVKLQHANVRSPFNGVIDRIPYKLGSLISEGTLLTTLSDLSAMNVYFKVSEIDYLTYLKKFRNTPDTFMRTKVELVLADGSTYPLKGSIETIESQFEEGTGVLALRARFENPDHVLKHGSNGKIKIRRLLQHVMVIPQKSVMEIQDKYYVYYIDSHQTAMMKSFVPLQRFGDYYIVLSGLKPGEQIVYEGVQNLREGRVIKPVYMHPDKVYQLKKGS